MGAIRTVPHFQDGGLADSMLFPPLDQGQPPAVPPSAAPAPAPVPVPAAPPAPALNINPNYPQGNQPVTEVPTDDNIELNKAQREDMNVLRDENSVLSHRGDHKFLVPRPDRPTEDTIRSSPEWQRTVDADQWLQQNAGTMGRAEANAHAKAIDAKRKQLIKQVENDYKAKHDEWKRTEGREAANKADIDRISSGTPLEGQWATIGDQYKTHVESLKNQSGPQAEVNRLADPSSYMSASAYKDSMLRIGQMNNMPLERANETLRHLAGPNGSYNGRKGIAAANYKIKGTDVDGNIWLETADGMVRVPDKVYDQLEATRHKSYRALQEHEKKLRDTPPRRSIGERVKKGLGLE